PGGAADRLQTLSVREVDHHDLADQLGLAVGEGGEHVAALVDVQAGQLTGGVAVLVLGGHGGHGVVLGHVTEVDGHTIPACDGAACTPGGRIGGVVHDLAGN